LAADSVNESNVLKRHATAATFKPDFANGMSSRDCHVQSQGFKYYKPLRNRYFTFGRMNALNTRGGSKP
jgi:hypothetical protein